MATSLRWTTALVAAVAVVIAACTPAQPSAPEAPAAPKAQQPAAPQPGSKAAQPAPKAEMPAEKPAAKAETYWSVNAETQRLIDAARANGERELRLGYEDDHLGGADRIPELEQIFSRLYGLNATFEFTPGPSRDQAVARFIQEATAGQRPFSDVINLSPSHYGQLWRADVLEKYDWQTLLPGIPDSMFEADNTGVQINSRAAVIPYNSNLIPADQAPRTLMDVFKPEWKGKVGSTPTAALLDTLAYHPDWGPERFTEYVRQLSEWACCLVRGGEAGERIAAGEFLMLVVASGWHDVEPLMARGAPLNYVVPEDNVTMNFTVSGVPVNSAAPNLSKLFVAMQLHPDVQQIMFETMGMDHTELPVSQTAHRIEAIKAKGLPIHAAGVQFEIDHPEKAELKDEFTAILRAGAQ